MKYIILSILVLFSVSAYSQIQDTPLFVGKYFGNQSGGGSGYWQVTGNFTDESGYYDATSIQIGDVLFFVDAGIGYHLPVTSIISASGSSFTIRVNNTGISGVAGVPNGPGGIYRANSPKGIWPFTAGLTASDQQTLNSFLIKRLNNEPVKRDTSITFFGNYNLGAAIPTDVIARRYNKIELSGDGPGSIVTVTLPDADPSLLNLEVVVVTSSDTIQVQASVGDQIRSQFRKVHPVKVNEYRCLQVGAGIVWKGSVWDSLGVGGSSGSGWKITIASTSPSDTTVIWAKSPLKAGVYDCYVRVLGKWIKKAWLSQDGVFSWKKPINMVIAGQSNAGGVMPGGDTTKLNGIIAYQSGYLDDGTNDGNYWTTARSGYYPFCCGPSRSYNNIGYQIAKQIVKNGDADIVRIFTSYRGGTGAGAWIQSGTDSAIKATDSLRNDIIRSGFVGDTIHLWAWHQGENGGPSSAANGGYITDLELIYDTLEAKIPGYIKNYTKFVAGTLQNNIITQPAIGTTPEGAIRRMNFDGNPNTGSASAAGLRKPDGTHFSGPAMDTLGYRYYAVFKNLPSNQFQELAYLKSYLFADTSKYTDLLLGDGSGINTNLRGQQILYRIGATLFFTISGAQGKINIGDVTSVSTTGVLNMRGRASFYAETGTRNLAILGNTNALNVSSADNVWIGNYTSLFSPPNINTSVFIGNDVIATSSSAPTGSIIIGYRAGYGITNAGFGGFVDYIGSHAGYQANGRYNSAKGYQSMYQFTGDFALADGMNSLNQATTANYSVVGGYYAGYKMVGRSNTGRGAHSLFSASSKWQSAYGHNTLVGSSADGGTAVGWSSGAGNGGVNNSYFGIDATSRIDSANAIAVITSDITSNTISNAAVTSMIAAKGLTTGNRITMRYVDGNPASGFDEAENFRFEVMSSSSIRPLDSYFTLPSLSFTLYPYIETYTNSTALGARTRVRASNTVYLGNDSVTAVRTGAEEFVFSNGVKIYTGSGSPEGVIAAPLGSIYLNSLGGAGVTWYAKETGGSGNTGWVAK